MITIAGILVVLAAIAGGYLMEHGNLLVLLQPAELVIIFGAAIGTLIIANPVSTLRGIGKGLLGLLGRNPYSRKTYTESLRMLYDLFSHARKSGMAKLEEDVDNPAKCEVFQKYPKFLKNHQATHFLCDTLRMAVTGIVDPLDIDQMMEVDLEVCQRESHEPVAALTTMADALPGLGIVAAVLGVVITMGSLGAGRDEIGHKVAAALVGTFLGVLLCYGIFLPLATAMGKRNDSEGQYYGFLSRAALAFVKGLPPILAVEFARRSIPAGVRPTFKEMETACRGDGAAGKGAKAA